MDYIYVRTIDIAELIESNHARTLTNKEMRSFSEQEFSRIKMSIIDFNGENKARITTYNYISNAATSDYRQQSITIISN